MPGPKPHPAPSKAAQYQRASRARKRRGIQLLSVECDAELREFLKRRGLLGEDASLQAVRDALTKFLCSCVYEDLDAA